MENPTISFSFDNVLADHLAAERLYYKSTVFAKLDKVVAVILLLVGLFSTWEAGVQWWTLIFFPLAILEWFNLFSVRPLVIRRWFKHNPKFGETYHLTLDPGGIHFRTKSIDSRLTWAHYTKVLEDDRLWLLVYGTRMYSVIPKRALKSNDEVARFRSLVAQNIVARSGKGA
jgi:hypothetical protein